MKIYLITSNKYTKKLCPVNVHFLNKYWPNNQITIVGYDDVNMLENLPKNVSKVCLGNQKDYGSTWTSALIPFFKKVTEDYFTIVFDDHILMNLVDEKKIFSLENQFLNNNADKAMIGGGIPLKESSIFKKDKNLVVFNQNVMYRLSLHPAIWSKKYFLKYLKPNLTPWEFELQNRAKFDNAVILNYNYNYPEQPHLFSYLELYTKGKINIDNKGNVITNQPSSRYFNIEDLKYIWENLH